MNQLKRFFPYIAYPALYLVSLLFFSVLVFPFERVKDRVVLMFNESQRASGGTQQLSIGELDSSFLTGVVAKNVKLVSPASDPAQPPTEMNLEEVRARISVLPLLVGRTTVSFKAQAFGGELRGEFSDSAKERNVEVTFDGVDVGALGPARDLLGVPLTGRIFGDVRFSMPERKAAKGSGTVALEIRDFSVGDGKAKIKGAIALPTLNVGNLTITADAKEGAIKVSKLGSTGPDVEVQGDGRIQMRDLAMESSLDVYLRFKISDAYRGKSDMTKTLFGAPGSNVPALFEMDPKVKASKCSDGFYSFHVRGPLKRPDFEPAPGGGAAPGASGGTK